MEKKYKSDIRAAIHDIAEGLYCTGSINKETKLRFDESCLVPVEPMSASEIRKIRRREKLSPKIFAYCLNVKKSIVDQWETGKKNQLVRHSNCFL
jgi:putative transcriptional regulator